MAISRLRTKRDIEEIYNRHWQTVYKACMSFMKNAHDTEDMVQNTFINLYKYQCEFESETHEKAWLIRAAINLCKDNLKHWWRKRENIDDYENLSSQHGFEINETQIAVMELPNRYKEVILLHYYAGYKTDEIAEMLSKPPSTIRNHLSEARKLLKSKLGGDFDE